MNEVAAPTAPLSSAARAPKTDMMDQSTVEDCLSRLAKASGQVQGISRMIQQGRYCIDVLNQINAAQKALDAVAEQVTRNYLQRCVAQAVEGGDPLIYDEVMRVVFRRGK